MHISHSSPYSLAMGESIQFPKPESEIRFGWGISYKYIGQMHIT